MNLKVLDILKKYTMVFALIAIVILFYYTTEGKILLPQNINNLLSQNAYVFVLASGMLLCILTGGNIDLAVGSVVCFVGGIGAVMMDKDINVWLAVVVMIIGGLLVGAWQGFWIAYIKVPPFIATLAGMYAFRGLANKVLKGLTIGVRNKVFLNVFGGGDECFIPDFFHRENINFNITCMAAGVLVALIFVAITLKNRVSAKSKGYDVAPFVQELFKMIVICAVIIWIFYKLSNYKGIPVALIWISVILLIYQYITTKTTMGRYLYAVGGNEKATRLSGIDPRKVYFFAYVNMGFLAGLAGMLTIARQVGAAPQYGNLYEMDAIAACFIGGASAYGGEGNVFGVIIGALLMGVINMGLSILGGVWGSPNIARVIKGLVVLAAIIFDVLSKKKKK